MKLKLTTHTNKSVSFCIENLLDQQSTRDVRMDEFFMRIFNNFLASSNCTQTPQHKDCYSTDFQDVCWAPSCDSCYHTHQRK
jgi:hypothetical protein